MQLREPGQVLGGKYRLTSQLSEGGMGAVWTAEHLTLHSPVALKLIDPIIATDPQAVQRFLREARTAALLRSPHVVQILDYGVDGDTPYIAMEMLEGESLAARLERTGRMTLTETARVIRHVSRAIGRAHDAGIVHRDLKPENIFIVRNDDEEVIKVLDFGIVKANPTGLDLSISPTSTRTGTLLGTPYFMSPEQAEGVKSVDFRADIWALGVVAYRCVLGELPFRGDSIGRLILEICSHPMPVPSQFGPVPLGFDAWFARACARDAAARFESAKRAADEFERLDGGAWAVPSSREEPLPLVKGSRPGALLPSTTTSQLSSAEVLLRPHRFWLTPRWLTALLVGSAIVAVGLLLYVGRASSPASRVAASAAGEKREAPDLRREPVAAEPPGNVAAPTSPAPTSPAPTSPAPTAPAAPATAPAPRESAASSGRDGPLPSATDPASGSSILPPGVPSTRDMGPKGPEADTADPPRNPRASKRRPSAKADARRRRKAANRETPQEQPAPPLPTPPKPAPPVAPPSVDLGI